ncbi:MAG: DUF192 domain-containing protein [Candidatus Aenigmatarchaeota archaeon]
MISLSKRLKISHGNDKFLEVGVADRPGKRVLGLMFRKVRRDYGLLFPFSHERRWSIWMPFVPQDLAVFWLDEKREVVDKKIARKISLDPDTWKTYKPEEECKYVLECHKEKIDEIDIGDKLEWDRDG